jgi:COMPASS component SWD3
MSLSPDGLYFSTASDDGTALVFALDWIVRAVAGPPSLASTPGANPQALRTLAGHTAPVLAVSFCPRANLLATGSYDESAIIWDLRRGKAQRTLPAHAEAIWSVGWDSEGALVITGSADGLM